MASDACLVGCGGVSNGQFFHCVFPDFIVQQNLHINALELLSVIVCLKLWGQRGRKICIQCDNMVSVQVINQGKSRSRFLQACLREICFICAIKECELRAIHIDGIENRLPDMLSRWSLSDSYSVQFYEAIEDSVTIGELSLSVDLHMLKTQAQESLKSAHASGTRKNLKIQWKAFFLFCHFYNLKTLPCELNTLCLFAQFLSRSFKSVDSIRNYLNGVKVLHLLFDLPFIHFESFYFRLFMKGLKRCNPHTVRAALLITPCILLKIREELNFDDVNSYTYWCIFLFAFYLICRKSNLVGTVDDSSKCLHRENISVFEDYLLVQFRWSKTIQFGERVLEIPIVKNLSSPLCAFSAFKAMCLRFPASASSPAFLVLSGRKTKPVSYNMLQSFLKNIVEKIGLDPTKYSSHSFRRGGATWAFQCGVSSELIQLQGDWKSDAYKLYLRYGLDDKMQVSSKMMGLKAWGKPSLVISDSILKYLPEMRNTQLQAFGFWRQELFDYEDQEICDMLEFGWPLGFDRKFEEFGNSKIVKNHTGARNFAKDIDKYIKKEVGYGAVLGPFASNPFNDLLVISPLNSVPKANSEERRVIMDLSFPKGKSVNDGIDKNVYLGKNLELHYPNVDNFIEIIKEKGKFCKNFKRDLRRAYRQIPVDPKDYNLIGFTWKGHYFVDRVLPMGLKSSAFICQSVTNAVRFIAKKHDISLINYLDDFAGAEISEKADISYTKLKWVLDSCGLEKSVEKASSPSHRMSFLGVWFDTEKMTMEVTPDRLVEIFDLVSFWLNKDTASLKEVQSLIGKLNFIASCVRPGRIFISRILNFLREFKNEDCILEVSVELKHDLLWWSEFLEIYNGVSLLNLQEWTQPDEYMASDACLVGCGGVSNGQFFHCVFPDFIVQQNLHINALELLSVIVCLKLWGQRGRKICIQCDNMVSVQVINQGKSRSRFL
ncbi:unnamed protein product [Mytilus edulis]|uniref:Tyr recombinase domain-containing protein n=1 Tax=Mytilus edulis TaxID=6550 RepID=A0A8S3SEE3_MYTED|nr:unnamed protein product [Mytilus edulis]